MNIFQIAVLLLASACSLSAPDIERAGLPERPANGYQRSQYFDPYISAWVSGLEVLPRELKKRSYWLSRNAGFVSEYSWFPVGFNSFHNTGGRASFPFEERLFFCDVFDLIRYAVNSPVFAEEILKRSFYENDGATPKSPQEVLNEIRTISFAVALAKRSLGEGVLAEATVGGYNHLIWLRDDVDYTKESINELAVIVLHEITHNLGYSHPSEVNYGVHVPVQEALRYAGASEAALFVETTPYYENIMLDRVRTLSGRSIGPRPGSSCSFKDIFTR